MVPVDQFTALDASSSIDENTGDNSNLLYFWSCSIASYGSLFGSQCAFSVSNTSHVFIIPTGSMSVGMMYSITVEVASLDKQRSSSSSVVVTGGHLKSVYTTIQTADMVKFNPAQRLQLIGSVKASLDILVQWNVSVNNQPIALVAGSQILTPQSKYFSGPIAANSVSFSLGLERNALSPGFTYNFLFTGCFVQNSSICSQSSISIYTNKPPQDGITTITPSIGYALNTSFLISGTSWTAESDSYPLSYQFSYATSMTATGAELSLAQQQPQTYIYSILPPGEVAAKNLITVIVRCSDRYSGTAMALNTVQVIDMTKNIDLASVVSDSVDRFLNSGNTAGLFQSMSSISSVLNEVNCSAAPDCVSLYRDNCGGGSANTCGSCMTGYVGVVGESNGQCHPTSESNTAGLVGSSCYYDSDCIYGECSSSVLVEGICRTIDTLSPNIRYDEDYRSCWTDRDCPDEHYCNSPSIVGNCTIPNKKCLESTNSSTCSGHGQCTFEDAAGSEIYSCSMLDLNCRASCKCDKDYFGASCALSNSALLVKQNARVSVCNAMLTVLSHSDASSGLLSAMANILAVAYSPTEILTEQGQSVCKAVMTRLSSIAGDTNGQYLALAPPSTITSLLKAASLIAESSRTNQDLSSFGGGDGTRMLQDNYTSSGEFATYFSMTSIMNDVINGISVTIANGQTESFVQGNVKMSITSLLVASIENIVLTPPPNAEEAAYGAILPSITLSGSGLDVCNFDDYIPLSIVQWGVNPYSDTAGGLNSSLLQLGISGQAVPSLDTNVHGARPVYFISLQFNAKLDLNKTKIDNTGNVTLPECREYVLNSYMQCSGCNISSYTEYNVTYACYDITQFCSGFNRNVLPLSRSSPQRNADLVANVSITNERVYLQNVVSYGVIFESIGDHIKPVFGTNPFVNLHRAKSVLIFVSLLVFIIVIGSIYFIRWDAFDHNYEVYVRRNKAKPKINVVRTEPGLHSPLQYFREFVRDLRELATRSNGSGVSSITMPSELMTIDSNSSDESITVDEDYNNSSNNNLKSDWNYKEPRRQLSKRALYKQNQKSLDPNWSVLAKFLHAAIPGSDGTSVGLLNRLWDLLWKFHPYFLCFAKPSQLVTRTMRWLSTCRGILIALFIDTVFFSVFYRDDGTCESFTTMELCLSMPSPLSPSSTACNWNKDSSYCSLASPRLDPLFIIVLPLLCILFSVPIEFLLSYIMEEYCSRRPSFERWGWVVDAWLGSEKLSFETSPGIHELSTLSTLANFPVALTPDVEAQFSKRASSLSRLESSTVHDASAVTLQPKGSVPSFPTRWAALGAQTLNTDMRMYSTLLPAADEAQSLLDHIHSTITDKISRPIIPGLCQTTANQEHFAMIASAYDFLEVDPSGGAKVSSVWDMIKHGFRSIDALEMVTKKIERARKDEDEILNQLEWYRQVGDNEQLDFALIQSFVFEQVSFIHRYALRAIFFQSHAAAPSQINPWTWVASWVFVISCFVFFLYWIFAWGVTNAGVTLGAWGLNFAYSVIQDVFVIQVLKVFIVYVLVIEDATPHVSNIHHVLTQVAIKLGREGTDKLSKVSVAQYLSGACRASRRQPFSSLPAAFILRLVDDVDVLHCRYDQNKTMRRFIFTIIVVPAALALISEAVADHAMEIIIPAIVSGFVMFNMLLCDVHPALLIGFYLLIVSIVIFFLWVYQPAMERFRQVKKIQLYKLSENQLRARQPQRRKAVVRGPFYVWSNYCHRLYTRMVDMLCSIPACWTDRYHQNTALNQNWLMVNSPRASQARVLDNDVSSKFVDVELDIQQFRRDIPYEISSMICKSPNTMSITLIDELNKYDEFGSFSPTMTVPGSNSPQKQPVVSVFVNNGNTATLMAAMEKEISFSPEFDYHLELSFVLKIVLEDYVHHVQLDMSTNEIDAFLLHASTDPSDILPTAQLTSFVRSITKLYAPAGIPLTAVESDEIVEWFEEWFKRQQQITPELTFFRFRRWLLHAYNKGLHLRSKRESRHVPLPEHIGWDTFYQGNIRHPLPPFSPRAIRGLEETKYFQSNKSKSNSKSSSSSSESGSNSDSGSSGSESDSDSDSDSGSSDSNSSSDKEVSDSVSSVSDDKGNFGELYDGWLLRSF